MTATASSVSKGKPMTVATPRSPKAWGLSPAKYWVEPAHQLSAPRKT